MTIPPLVWMYWEQRGEGPRAAYLDLCEESVRVNAAGMDVRVLDLRAARRVLPSLPAEIERLSLNHQSDLVRAHALLHHGGIWIDADTVAVRPITNLVKAAGEHSFVTFPDGDGAHVGVALAKPGTLVARAWVERQKAEVLAGPDAPWAGFGSDALMPGFVEHGGTMLPIETVAPIDWADWEVFMSRTYPLERVLVDRPVLVSFYNAFMGPVLADVPAEQVRRSHRLYARLLRYSLDGEASRLESVRSAAFPLVGWTARARRSATHRAKALRSRVSS